MRDEALPSTLSVIKGTIGTISVPRIYAGIPIGTTLSIKLRQTSTLKFISFDEEASTDSTTISIDATGLQVEEHELSFESYNDLSNVKATLKTDTIALRIVERCTAVEEALVDTSYEAQSMTMGTAFSWA